MSDITDIHPTNAPFKIGAPQNMQLTIQYFLRTSGVVAGKTKLLLHYDIRNNNANAAFGDGNLTCDHSFVLQGDLTPQLPDTLTFMRTATQAVPQPSFTMTVTATLQKPDADPFEFNLLVQW